jgi:type IX secretion system PorP/SprF family membrane protein
MMMKRFLFCLLFIVLIAELAAQDPQFSQYYQAPLYLNPGFTGITPQQRLVYNHRIQWPNLPQAFSTSAFSYDIFVDELRSGFGVLVTNDVMGSAGWRTNTAGLLYSFKVKLNDNLVFSPGLYFGYGTNGLDRSRLTLGDGLEFQGQSLDPELNKLGRQDYFDFGSGFIFYNRNLWLGGAFHHMNQPNLSVLNDVSRLPMKTSIHGGARLSLYNGPRTLAKVSYLTPSFIFRKQGKSFSQLDVGINYHIDPVSVGFWYRGKPFEKTVINSVAQDALILSLGMYFKNLSIGYSYDFTISELQTAAGGAHEIAITYEFTAKPLNRNIKRKYRMIPCPSFNSKEGFWN